MAGIGLYGVYYSKATLSDGVVQSYTGIKTMGKAISADFTPAEGSSNILYANNMPAETDSASGAGGTLNLTLDKLTSSAYTDLFGLTAVTTTVTVDTETVTGTGYDYTGSENANVCGVAFIRQHQESQSRAIHEAVIFSNVTFKQPSDSYKTMEDSVDWQTPEIEGTVVAGAACGQLPWMKKYTFPSQAAAEQFITNYFAAPNS